VAVFCCAAAYAQEPPGAALPGTSPPGTPIDCAARSADLKARKPDIARALDEVTKEGAALAQESEDLQRTRAEAEKKGAAEVAAYNARRNDLNARFATHNERVAAVNEQIKQFNAETDETNAQCKGSLRMKGDEETKLDADERAVLAIAVADRLGRDSGTIMLEDHTATFLCSRSLPDVMQLDGCSGMRRENESPQDVIAKLKRALPGVSEAALADLLAKGDQRARIGEPLALPVQQVLRGYGESTPATHTDASVKVSRVGFDAERREAIAFVAVRSKERSFTGYVRLERKPEGWAVTGRASLP
jgi:hypothetical protein